MTPSDAVEPFDREGFLNTLTQRPGVYRMLDVRGEVIYVGKAKNLKKGSLVTFSPEIPRPSNRPWWHEFTRLTFA